MSLSAARWCISVTKQRSNCAHLRARAEFGARVDLRPCRAVLRQRRISARSPISVVFSHSRMIWKSATSSKPESIGDFGSRRSSAGRRSCCGLSCSRRAAGARTRFRETECRGRKAVPAMPSCRSKSRCGVPRECAGTRYASVLPVPVPASTISLRLPLSASSTASAISIWPGPPLERRVFRRQHAARAKKLPHAPCGSRPMNRLFQMPRVCAPR